jgi:hypothetical protein
VEGDELGDTTGVGLGSVVGTMTEGDGTTSDGDCTLEASVGVSTADGVAPVMGVGVAEGEGMADEEGMTEGEGTTEGEDWEGGGEGVAGQLVLSMSSNLETLQGRVGPPHAELVGHQ